MWQQGASDTGEKMIISQIRQNEIKENLQIFRDTLIQEEMMAGDSYRNIGLNPNTVQPVPEHIEGNVAMYGPRLADAGDRLTDTGPRLADAGDRVQRPTSSSVPRHVLMKRVETVINSIVLSILCKNPPSIVYGNTRLWDNVRHQTGTGLHMVSKIGSAVRFDFGPSANKLGLTVKMLSIIYQLLNEDKYRTKRDLFYQDVQLYGSQATVDNIVDNISCMLDVPRWDLHVLATSKGCVAGDLQFLDGDGNNVDCSKTDTGVLVPNHVTAISNLTSEAQFVLIVEKDAVFQQLLDEDFCRKLLPCILITGKGYPDINTRLLVRKIWTSLHLPTFALVDADPHGIEIMSVYKHGSRGMSFVCADLAVPSIRWLGVIPSDIESLQLKSDSLLKMTTKDIKKGKELLSRSYITEDGPLRNQLELILKRGLKAEIECLANLSANFLMEVYIPYKLYSRTWI